MTTEGIIEKAREKLPDPYSTKGQKYIVCLCLEYVPVFVHFIIRQRYSYYRKYRYWEFTEIENINQ